MPRAGQRNTGAVGSVSQIGEYVKLEQRLVLAAWVCQKLGYVSNKAMFENLSGVDEGFDGMGRSFLVQAIASRGSQCLIPLQDLERYDVNIKEHLAYFNKHRKEALTLRYFQHLSLLISEFFLDQLFNHKQKLSAELNQFVTQRNSKRGPLEPQDPDFNGGDLSKFAFWMATGSGKTILMHFHYRQFLHYCSDPLDNILLVTPDESLSQQHIENMEASGIPCGRFSLNDSGFESVKKNAVRVIEITKLVEEKKGSGVSVPVEAFEGRNLIFVDEGHRGASSEANRWLGNRQKLAATGYTFEYSATFGQAMTAARDEDMTKEYGKAILFDYSYKYFYGDGFGKDFDVLNLRQETTEEQTRTLLLANLLAFHEQKRSFQTKSTEMLRYHLADPLWIFVGSTVNKSKNDKQAKESDVLTVIKFFDAFLRNERQWVQKWIKKILAGDSGIADDAGNDVFATRFRMLKSWQKNPDAILRDIMKRIFHTSHGGRLHVGDIKGKAGELGLKVSGSDHYFGLVYIGDTSSFKQLIADGCPDVEVEDDQIGEGLFENIKKPDSRINILVGAKKFMQGWDSWRVTNMGLLNIGRSEGSEIIQLFGRGVRLKGFNRCLKRSSALLVGSHPMGIELLERLNIFAIRANYMTQFREYLEREGIEPLGDMELALPIKRESVFLKKGLLAPRLPKDSCFTKDETIVLEPDSAAKVVLNFAVQVERIGTQAGAFQTASYTGGIERWASPELLKWLDWEDLYLEMLNYKEEKGFYNLVIRPEHPRKILEASDPKLYALICDESILEPKTSAGVLLLQRVMEGVLKKYVERFYRKRQQRWDSKHMVYVPIDRDDDNFQDYILKVPRSDKAFLQTIQTALADWTRMQKTLSQEIPHIHFDRHLFQPLLISKGRKLRCSPPSLNPGEARFVNDLKNWLQNPSVLIGKEFFLLRNLSRGKGIGFFEDNGFFPDFMLWITEGKKQRFVFIEPHGMMLEDHPTINPKVGLYKKLQTQNVTALKGLNGKSLTLDSFIISLTPFDDLRRCHGNEWNKNKYADEHILFFGDHPNDCAYIKRMLSEDLEIDNQWATQEKPSVFAQILAVVDEKLKFKQYLPVYSLSAACGKFGEGRTDIEPEGWVHVNRQGLDETYFVVQAVGHSMKPKIEDGNYCMFKLVSGGPYSGAGRIFLFQYRGEEDPDTKGTFTIKGYRSHKGADGFNMCVDLLPINKDYPILKFDENDSSSLIFIAEFLGLLLCQ